MTKPFSKGLKRALTAGTLGFVFAAAAGTPALAQDGAAPEAIIPLSGPIVPWTQPVNPSGTLNLVRAGLKFFNEKAPGVPITIEINSPGGDGVTMFSILDAMAMSNSPVNTRCVGYAASAGAYILMAGKYREAWASCNLLIHGVQISGGQPDVQRAGVDVIKDNKMQNAFLQNAMDSARDTIVRYTKLDPEIATALIQQDCRMPLQTAKALNIIDRIIDPNDSHVNDRRYEITADNVCVGVHFSDELVQKMRHFHRPPASERGMNPQ